MVHSGSNEHAGCPLSASENRRRAALVTSSRDHREMPRYRPLQQAGDHGRDAPCSSTGVFRGSMIPNTASAALPIPLVALPVSRAPRQGRFPQRRPTLLLPVSDPLVSLPVFQTTTRDRTKRWETRSLRASVSRTWPIRRERAFGAGTRSELGRDMERAFWRTCVLANAGALSQPGKRRVARRSRRVSTAVRAPVAAIC